jgi:hypothetical protein
MNIFHVGNLLQEFVNEFDELRKSCSRFVKKNVCKIGVVFQNNTLYVLSQHPPIMFESKEDAMKSSQTLANMAKTILDF